tara:strand:+ start:158 stop:913 length:756 start_codon:yes stop_codon:yes gene_type:complete
MKKIFLFFVITVFTVTNAVSKENENVKDCFEKVNRVTFAFNQGLDKVIFEPVAKGYRHLPSPIRIGTSNVLNNLSNLVTIPNNILQGNMKDAGINTIRLVINSTFGLLGVFDAAQLIGFEQLEKEDYGQTLGVMGADPGCYLVLPVLGPSTVRDTIGTAIGMLGGDPWYNVTVKNDTQYVSHSDYYISRVTSGVDFRAKNIESFDNLEENAIDFYVSVRSLYLQDRKKKILNSQNITETMDDSDWDEIETK